MLVRMPGVAAIRIVMLAWVMRQAMVVSFSPLIHFLLLTPLQILFGCDARAWTNVATSYDGFSANPSHSLCTTRAARGAMGLDSCLVGGALVVVVMGGSTALGG